MLSLHKVLLKVLAAFYENFLSDFRGPEIDSKPQTFDVENNSEILQFNIVALYKLDVTWINNL